MESLFTATYPITNGCNISCPWCAAHLGSQPLFNTRHIIGALDRAIKTYGPLHGVALSGGEPFSSSRLLAVKADLEAAGHRVFAITNGTMHDQIFEFVNGDTLDVALSVHNSDLFPTWVVEKKQALVNECRKKGLKIMGALFSVDSVPDIAQALDYLTENHDVFHTATISTVYHKNEPAMETRALLEAVFDLRPETRAHVMTPNKVAAIVDGHLVTLRRTPTAEEYFTTHEPEPPGCLMVAWNGEFMPGPLAHYSNEGVLV